MSLQGLIWRRGSLTTVYARSDAERVDGDTARTYPTNVPNVGMFLEDLTDELMRRVFGAEHKATVRAIIDVATPAIALDDGVAVISGPHAGENFRVAGILLYGSGGSPHRELALERTPEVFT